MAETIDWTGALGNSYRYWFIYQMENPLLKRVGGNYMFVAQHAGGWYPVYIGQTGDLNERLANHPALPCVLRNGGTRLMAHETPAGRAARLAEESDLISYWNPPCNG